MKERKLQLEINKLNIYRDSKTIGITDLLELLFFKFALTYSISVVVLDRLTKRVRSLAINS